MSNSVTPWTAACQAPLFMGFPRQEYWSEQPFLSPGDLPYTWIEPRSLALPEKTMAPHFCTLAWSTEMPWATREVNALFRGFEIHLLKVQHTMACRQNPDQHLFCKQKVLLRKGHTHSFVDCLGQLSCNKGRGYLTCRAWNIYYLALFRNVC